MSAYRETTLPNGLRVASEAMPGAHSVAVVVSIDVGSRHEEKKENGISHFLEHMAFKGTKTYSARQIAEIFDDAGASLNAYTSTELTVYYARLLPKDLSLAVRMFADILQNSTFEEEELERERGVILQEIAMHHDVPEDLVFDYFHETVYPEQAIGRSILGTKRRINSFQADDLRAYMDRHYLPARMVISAAGAVDHEQFVSLVQEHFHYEKSESAYQPEKAQYKSGGFRKPADFEQMHLVIGFPGLSYLDPDYYAGQMLATALGGGMSSRLFQEVREKRGLAYNVYAFLSSFIDGGMFGMYAAADESSARKLLPVLCDEVLRAAEDGLTQVELERARNQHVAGMHMVRDNPAAVAKWIGRHLLYYGQFRDMDVLSAEYEKVTCDDVMRVLRRLLADGKVASVALGPQEGLPAHEDILARFAKPV